MCCSTTAMSTSLQEIQTRQKLKQSKDSNKKASSNHYDFMMLFESGDSHVVPFQFDPFLKVGIIVLIPSFL